MQLSSFALGLCIIICNLQTANSASIGFKTDRIEKEFVKDLANYNFGLEQLILDVAVYSEKHFQKNIVITEVYRTKKEQQKIYGKKAKTFRSPHQDWAAVDVRSWVYTDKEVEKLVRYINKRYNKTNEYKKTAHYHNAGFGRHIHIQYKRNGND